MANPYRALSKGYFPIAYEGEVGDYHCFRVDMSGGKAYEQYQFRSQIEEWLLRHAYGGNTIGNGFGASKNDPVVPFSNPTENDVFVLFESMLDIVRFEEVFPVTGFSPSLVA